MMNLPASSSPQVEPAIYSLSLVSKLTELVKLSEWLQKLVKEINLAADVTFKLELVLTEAVTNIIQHGYNEVAHGNITIKLQHQKNQLSIEIRDKAKPFDPLQQPEVEFPRTLEEASEGGLGIHLIRNYTAQCDYQRLDNQNVLTMVLVTSKKDEPHKPDL